MSDQQAPESAFGGKYHFLVRRLHSLSGLVPVGVFLCMHLFANASIMTPGEPGAQFQSAVDRIRSLGPFLVPVEMVGIFLPLLFHALVGFMIIFSGKSNAQQYPHLGNVRYTLQRTTGMIAMVFILYHVWQMHWLGRPFGGAQFEFQDAARSAAAPFQSAWWVAPIYAIGVLSCVFHLANGLWTSLITWGITIKPRSQRVAGYVCSAFGVVLALAGLGAINGFRTFVISDGTVVSTSQVSPGLDVEHGR